MSDDELRAMIKPTVARGVSADVLAPLYSPAEVVRMLRHAAAMAVRLGELLPPPKDAEPVTLTGMQ